MSSPITLLRDVDSTQAFKYHWKCWKLLGIYPTNYCKFFYVPIAAVIFSLPLTMIILLFYLDRPKDILAILSICVTLTACTLKHINILIQRNKILKVNEWIRKLDARAESLEEQEFFRSTVRTAHRMFRFTFGLFLGAGIFCELAALASRGEQLMYPAWYPFDWQASIRNYAIAHIHQLIAVGLSVFNNCAADTFPAIYMSVLTSHIRALNIRVRKVGFKPNKGPKVVYEQLIECIKDHQLLIQYFKTVQEATSAAIGLQFFTTGIETCITAVYVFFIESNSFEAVFLALYFLSVILEMFLNCYFGNELISESERITEAIYSCNWMDQNERFKKIIVIFMQPTQKSMTIIAAGVFTVSASTFISVLQSSYSLFTVLISIT